MWSTTQRAGNTDDNPEGKPPQIATWHAHQGTVVSVEYLPRDQGALLLSASEDCTARLWTLDGQYIGMFGQVSSVIVIIAFDVRRTLPCFGPFMSYNRLVIIFTKIQ